MKKYMIRVNGKPYEVEVEEVKAGTSALETKAVSAPGPAPAQPLPPSEIKPAPDVEDPDGRISRVAAPMTGTIIKLNVNTGDSVKKGEVLLILEAMKMENEIFSPRDGEVGCIHISVGASVNTGDLMIDLE